MYLVIILFALFASLFGLSKDTLNYSEPFFLIGSRMTFAGVLLLTHQYIFNRKHFKFKLTHLKSLCLLSFFNIYLTNIAEIWGVQHMVSAKACLIYSLSPFVAALMSFLVLNETLTKIKWFGLFIGFIGLVPIFLAESHLEIQTGKIVFISLADIALLIAVFCSTYGWILLKKIVNEYHYNPLLANGFSMTLGGSLALIHSYLSMESWNPVPVNSMQSFIQNTLLMCLISNIICYNLYGYLLKRYSATFMAFSGLGTPLFASFFGWYFLGETITWHYFASLVVFSIGLSIFYQAELKTRRLLVNPNKGVYKEMLREH